LRHRFVCKNCAGLLQGDLIIGRSRENEGEFLFDKKREQKYQQATGFPLQKKAPVQVMNGSFLYKLIFLKVAKPDAYVIRCLVETSFPHAAGGK
jgi:hypothetical protein